MNAAPTSSDNNAKPVSTPSSQPPPNPPSLPPEAQFPKAMRDLENKKIWARRKTLSDQIKDSPPDPPGRIGLALSGGGIRSATFCLGVLQAMAGRGWIQKLDYLSTVSGGGYAGSFLGRMFTRDWVTKPEPQKPEGLADWPAGVKKAIDITETGFPAKRVESVLDDHGSAPMQWLRDSGRYLAPAGAGDLLLAGSVSFRNWVAVLVVVITALMTVFLCGATLRAGLWHWPLWQQQIEINWLMAATANRHWWWSPLLFLPAFVLLVFALPLGWAYWLTQKDHGNHFKILPSFTVVVVILLSSFIAIVLGKQALITTVIAVALAVAATLTLGYYAWAKRRAKAIFASKSDPASGSELSDNPEKTASELEQKLFTIMRNDLSRCFTTAFVAMASLFILAIVDSFGQMAYAVVRPHNGPGLKGFLTVTGLIALFGLARRIKLLLDQLPDKKSAQMPISVLAGIAAIFLAGSLLVSLSAAAHGFAWQWDNPNATNTVTEAISSTNTVTSVVSSTNAVHATNIIPAFTLLEQLHGKCDVKLTAENLIQVVEASSKIDTSPLASGMSLAWSGGAWGVCLLLTICFGRTLTFLNLSSHQALYAARISRAYHGASNPDRWFGQGQRLGEALPTDDVFWRNYQPQESGGPLHIVNVTLNETVAGKTQVEYRDRQGMIVAIGPAGMTIGSRFHALWKEGPPPASGAVDVVQAIVSSYHPLSRGTVKGETPPEQVVERLSLRQWIGISGAAFTTGLGKGTSAAKSLLLGLANIRLGYWWDSYIEPIKRKKALGNDYVQGNPIRDILAWAFPVQVYLFDEFLAKFRGPNTRLWYLSDGGHFENTAAYELIRRRVPCIIVCDCGADADNTFEDLGQLVRMVRVDFGAEIKFLDKEELDKSDLGASREVFGEPKDFTTKPEPPREGTKGGGVSKEQPDETTSRKGPHALLGWVSYPGDERRSLLVVLKPSLSGDESLDVANYRSAYPAFPQETTLDQFFDEAQWESYRKLGRHIGEEIFPGKDDPQGFTKLVPRNS